VPAYKQAAYKAAYKQCVVDVFNEYVEEIQAGLYDGGDLAGVCHDWARRVMR
jgi:hypothetical protein